MNRGLIFLDVNYCILAIEGWSKEEHNQGVDLHIKASESSDNFVGVEGRPDIAVEFDKNQEHFQADINFEKRLVR